MRRNANRHSANRIEQSDDSNVAIELIVLVELPVLVNPHIHQVERFTADRCVYVGDDLQCLEVRLGPKAMGGCTKTIFMLSTNERKQIKGQQTCFRCDIYSSLTDKHMTVADQCAHAD